jgi:hypothetical protein
MEAGMKTDRLTLMVSPADKAAINARATSLGISVSELVRKAALDYDPEIGDKQDQLEALLGEIELALDRIDTNFEAMESDAEAHRVEMQRLTSNAYREQVRRDVLADPTINWGRVQALVGAGIGTERSEAQAA